MRLLALLELLPLLGLVHLRNSITQHRPLAAGENLDLKVILDNQKRTDRGLEFDLVTEARASGRLIWEEVSTNLFRTGNPDWRADFNFGDTDKHRFDIQITSREISKVEFRLRDDRRNDAGINTAEGDPLHPAEMAEPDNIIIGGLGRIRGAAPLRNPFRAIVKTKHSVGVTHINCQKHPHDFLL